jgi:uncharacterized membrane protein YvbJ
VFCPKCGTENDNTAVQCSNCGQALGGQAPVAQAGAAYAAAPVANIPNYLVQAILSTLCCCLPFGIVAIIFAAQVNTKLAAGDIDGAMESSKKAKMWCWVSLGCGLAGMVLYAIAMLLPLMLGAAHG